MSGLAAKTARARTLSALYARFWHMLAHARLAKRGVWCGTRLAPINGMKMPSRSWPLLVLALVGTLACGRTTALTDKQSPGLGTDASVRVADAQVADAAPPIGRPLASDASVPVADAQAGDAATRGKPGSAGAGGGVAPNPCGKTALSQAEGRDPARVCPVSALGMQVSDAGTTSCRTEADCGAYLHCLGGTCTSDACFVDSECPADSACACAGDYYGGNGMHPNLCIRGQCRSDADCGGRACSPSFSLRCGGLAGNFCHTSTDSCNTDADCCGSTPWCRYQAPLGAWVCEAITVCNG
jgi:hypothetical protein